MYRFALLLLGLIVLCGCSGDVKKPIVPVEGKLKLSDGKPLPAGTLLLFEPTEGGTGTASATTEADGSFKLTHVSGSTGAETGKYTVKLTPAQGKQKEFYSLVTKDNAEGSLFAEVRDGMSPLELTVTKATPGKK